VRELEAQIERERGRNQWVAVLGGPVVIVAVFALAKEGHLVGWVKAGFLVSLAQIVIGVVGAVPLLRQHVDPARLVAHLEKRLRFTQRMLQVGVIAFFASVGCIAMSVVTKI
jgi:hypothetical protein